MPVCSYLVYPHTDKKRQLLSRLDTLSECEAFESVNNALVVLVTETKDDIQEGILQENLKLIPEIQSMALVYAGES